MRHAGRRAGCWLLLLSAGALACSSSKDSVSDARSSSAPNQPGAALPQGTNVSFGGAQDIGFLRDQLEAGQVPSMASLDAPGFFAEHHIDLPKPACGQRLCLQPMVAVMGNLMNGSNCTMLHLGLNSPIEANPGARPPLSLALVVDVSGSMQGEKIQYVRRGLGLLIDGMHDDDQLALITYSDRVEVVAKMSRVGDNRVALRRAVDDLVADGSTDLHGGLLAGYREVLAGYDSARQNRVILLSDGNPTAGVTGTEAILADSRTFNSDGVGLTTIGLGADFNIGLMRGLAQQADGNFYFLEDTGAIDEVFAEELSYFVVPVAFDLELSLVEGDAYRFGRALGAPLWKDTAAGGELSVPSVFVAHRESDDDVTVDGGRRGGGSSLLVELMPREDEQFEAGSAIATIDLSYREPGNDQLQHDSVELRYPYRPGELQERGYFDAPDPAPLQKSFVMLNIFVGMESAVGEFQRGSADSATLSQLDNLIAAVEDYNDEVDDQDIAADLELLDMLRDNMTAALGVRERSSARFSDPWPAD